MDQIQWNLDHQHSQPGSNQRTQSGLRCPLIRSLPEHLSLCDSTGNPSRRCLREPALGTRCCRTHARKMQPLIGPSTVRPSTVSGAVTRKAPTNVVVSRRPKETPSITRVLHWERPYVRVMLVFAHVSSTKTTCSGSWATANAEWAV